MAEEVGEEVKGWEEEESGKSNAGEGTEGKEGAEEGGGDD